MEERKDEELRVAFRKNQPGSDPIFYVGEERYNRLKDMPSAQPFDFLTLRNAVLRFYPNRLPAPDNLKQQIERARMDVWGSNGFIK